MDIREQIRTAMLDLSDTEEIIVLSIMIDALMEKVQNLNTETRYIRNVPISKIDPFPGHT